MRTESKISQTILKAQENTSENDVIASDWPE